MRTKISIKIIQVDEQGCHIFVKAKVNGKLAHLLVDTGASTTVFDSNRVTQFTDMAAAVRSEHVSTGLGTSSMQSQSIQIKKLQLGDLKITNYKAYLLDLSHVNATYQKLNLSPLDGVIGGDILLKYQATINYKEKQVKLNYK